MRVFVALACPVELLPAVERYQQLLQEVPDVRLLEASGLHVTVIPPWEERDPDAVLRDFAAVDTGPIDLVFDEAAIRQTPRGGLLWLGGASTPPLDRLWLQAWRAIQSHDPRQKPLPHVTIARFPHDAVLPELPPTDALSARLDRLCLYESQGDLRYRIIGEKRLA